MGYIFEEHDLQHFKAIFMYDWFEAMFMGEDESAYVLVEGEVFVVEVEFSGGFGVAVGDVDDEGGEVVHEFFVDLWAQSIDFQSHDQDFVDLEVLEGVDHVEEFFVDEDLCRGFVDGYSEGQYFGCAEGQPNDVVAQGIYDTCLSLSTHLLLDLSFYN